MRHFIAVLLPLGVMCGMALLPEAATAAEPMVAHNVYFTLKDKSEASRRALVADCHRFLAPIEGMVFYAAGELADLKRPVNDREFDVALHCVFVNRAALDKYAVHPEHMAFVEKNKHLWTKVRVFDSDVTRPGK